MNTKSKYLSIKLKYLYSILSMFYKTFIKHILFQKPIILFLILCFQNIIIFTFSRIFLILLLSFSVCFHFLVDPQQSFFILLICFDVLDFLSVFNFAWYLYTFYSLCQHHIFLFFSFFSSDLAFNLNIIFTLSSILGLKMC